METKCKVGHLNMSICGEDNDCSVLEMIKRDGSYEPWIQKVLAIVLNENAICIDAGANIGILSLVLASIAKQGQVYAFEPLPNNLHWLRENLQQNEVLNVKVINAAVGEIDSTQIISLFKTNNGIDYGGAMIMNASLPENSDQTFLIQQLSLDSWVMKEHIKKIDFIKLDIEGYEYAALLGAKETIRRFAPTLLVEFYPQKLSVHGANVPNELINFLFHFYKHIFLINRNTSLLVPINSYADIRAMMMTGHGVEDLICFPTLSSEILSLVHSNKRYATYGATWFETDLSNQQQMIHLSQFEDGWICGGEMALILNSPKSINLQIEFNESVCDQIVKIASPHKFTDIHLQQGLNDTMFQVELLEGANVIYISADCMLPASEYFNNQDPRHISIRLIANFEKIESHDNNVKQPFEKPLASIGATFNSFISRIGKSLGRYE